MMKLNPWNRLRGFLVVFVLLTAVLTTTLVLAAHARPALAEGEPWTVAKYAEPAEVPPGGTVNYTIVLSRTSGTTLLLPIEVSDHLDSQLTFVPGSVVVEPFGSLVGWDPNTPGYITFTVQQPNMSVITMSFESMLEVTAVSGDVISNTAVVSDPASIATSNVATFTVSQPPDLQIFAPSDGQIITQRKGTTLAVTGRAWGVFDPAPFPGVPALQPINNFGGGGTYNVVWSAVADATNYVVQESRTVDFSSVTTYPPVAAPTIQQFVSGKTPGTYYYRVAAYNALARPSRWSNIQSVTVTSVGLLSESPEGPVDASRAAMPVSDIISVIVSTDGGTTQYAATVTEDPGGWWNWTYNWTLPEADDVAYPLMARAAYVGGGAYGEDTITVTIDNGIKFVYLPLIFRRWPPVPYAPTLSATTPDVNSGFTVSWVYGSHPTVVPVSSYTLQEATNASFTGATEYSMGMTTYKAFTKSPATYYYRVRGVNTYGNGEWSNVVKVVVTSLTTYQFNTAGNTEGWTIKRSDEGVGEQLPQSIAKDGMLYHLIRGKADFSILSPLTAAPTPPYKITAYADIVNSEHIEDGYGGADYVAKQGMTYGIIFGGNGGTPCPTLKGQVEGCLYRYYRVLVAYDAGNASLKWQLKRIDYHDAAGEGRGVTLIDWSPLDGYFGDALGWNEWRVEVAASGTNNIKVYLNNHLVGQKTDVTYLQDYGTYNRFGVFQASPEELGAVATKWDWFKVEKY